MKEIKYILILLVMIAFTTCKKPYSPPATSGPASYLVVEGVIDPGTDSTLIKLSKTVNLAATVSTNPVIGANVMVVSNGGSVYQIAETGNGYYKALLKLPAGNTYQVKIITSDNKTYASDLVTAKNALPIDTVSTTIGSNGVQINLNTHDPSNSSRYYRWTYVETYNIHTPYYSAYEVQYMPVDTILPRPYADQINQCWITDTSSTIILGSTAKLTQDVVNQQPITFLVSTTEKLNDLYSINIQQYAVTLDAYNYYTALSKNTEQLGSIFDAQPSELTGNIHCTSNPAEIVIGYITAGSYSQKRIFIDSRKLPAWLPDNPYSGCGILPIAHYVGFPPAITDQYPEYFYNGNLDPVSAISGPLVGSKITGYEGATPFCTDCTLRGSNIKPGFWPN